LTGWRPRHNFGGMGRSWRAPAGGYVYHVLNRANARLPLFQKDGDYAAFERVLAEARELYDVPVLAYCVMPNHWHLVLWPRVDGDLSRFVGWLTLTHTQRWHAHYHTGGPATPIKVVSNPSRCKRTNTCCRSAATWNGTRCGRGWCGGPKAGAGPACGDASTGTSRRGRCWVTGRCRGRRGGRVT